MAHRARAVHIYVSGVYQRSYWTTAPTASVKARYRRDYETQGEPVTAKADRAPLPSRPTRTTSEAS